MADTLPVFDEVLRRIVARLAPASLVDLGCGRGHVGRLVAEAWPGCRCTGIDLDAAALQEAGRGGHYAELHQADALAWTEAHASPADLVVACGLLEHLPRSQGLDLLQAWVRRCAWLLLVAPEFGTDLPGPGQPPGARLRSVWSERDLHWHDLWAWDNARAGTIALLRGYAPWPGGLSDLVRASEDEDWPLLDFDGRTVVRPLRLRLVEHPREVPYRPA